MTIYYHDTPKPLAVYRERIARGVNPTEAKMDLYGEFYHRWRKVRRTDLGRFLRHFDKVRAIANREVERHERRAA